MSAFGPSLLSSGQAGRYWVWRVAPALTISRGEVDRALQIIDAAIQPVVGG